MSMISELVKELRHFDEREFYEPNYEEKLLNRAADTIEMLSEKVRESKQEWIPCSEKPPEIGAKTILLYDSEEISGGTYIGNRTFNVDFASKNEFVKVIAWMTAPEPWEGTDDETN